MSAPPDALPARVGVTIRGVVQGVGFRWFAQREASQLGLAGWVANQPDGSVAVVAEGSNVALEALVTALRHGPPGALVQAVDVRHEPARGMGVGFHIRSAAHRGD